MGKDMKIYRVHTAVLESKGGDVPNYDVYRISARDAEQAIEKTKKIFKLRKGEYVEEVEKVETLDE